MRLFAAFILAAGLAACTDPSVGAGIRLSPSGLSVVPTVGARVGGVGVAISP
ncbi:MAG: hypothetical protein ACOY4T_11180 [Pseudomonadota bacterium]